MNSILGSGSMPGLLLYKSLQQSQDKQFDAYSREPKVEREVAYFLSNIDSIESADDLLKDWRLKGFVLQSFGLEDFMQSNALMKRILTDDLDGEAPTAYSMRDPRFQEIAETLRLDKGVGTIKSSAVTGELITRYLTNGFETRIGEQNISARQAMYFQRNISTKSNIFQVMSDPTLREVVTVAVGLPKEVALLDFDKQVSMIEAKFDISKVSDSKYIDRTINQFLIRKDMESGGVQQNASVAGLFAPVGGGPVMGLNIVV
jgi:hypothetical protein